MRRRRIQRDSDSRDGAFLPNVPDRKGEACTGADRCNKKSTTVSKEQNEAIRRKQVRELFLSRPPEERMGQGAILCFYVWLREYRPEILPRGNDPYKQLELDLKGADNGI